MTKCFCTRATALAAAVMLTGCAGMDDGTRTRAEGAGAGAIIGAGAGALIGQLAGGRPGRGAAIGAGIGALGGLAVGDHVARKKARYATEEAWLDACIAHAAQVNQEVRAYNQSLTNQIAQLERDIAAAQAARDARRLRDLQAAVVNLQNQANQQLKTVDTEIQAQQAAVSEASPGSKTDSLRSQVGGLQSTRSSLNQNIDRLASLNDRIDV